MSPTAYASSNILKIPAKKSFAISWQARPNTTPTIPKEAIILVVSTPYTLSIASITIIAIKYLIKFLTIDIIVILFLSVLAFLFILNLLTLFIELAITPYKTIPTTI